MKDQAVYKKLQVLRRKLKVKKTAIERKIMSKGGYKDTERKDLKVPKKRFPSQKIKKWLITL
jgi:hypothetical protein